MSALVLGRATNSPYLGTTIYSAAGAIIALAWIVWVLREAGVRSAAISSLLIAPVAAIGGCCALAVLGRALLNTGWYWTVSVISATVMLLWAAGEGQRLIKAR